MENVMKPLISPCVEGIGHPRAHWTLPMHRKVYIGGIAFTNLTITH